jgi:methyltransferase-like protein
LSTEFEGLKLDLVISESKIDNKIRINGDAINQVQAEFVIIQNQLGEVVQQVDRLVNTNENNNTNNNNIAESIVRTLMRTMVLSILSNHYAKG